jgi:hypothetical protein
MLKVSFKMRVVWSCVEIVVHQACGLLGSGCKHGTTDNQFLADWYFNGDLLTGQ